MSTSSKHDQPTLERMYLAKQRPFCPCKTPGVEMYIARIGDQYIVKRMPDTGHLHAPSCDSYDPPSEVSGLQGVADGAVTNSLNGYELKLDFSLLKAKNPRICERTQSKERPDADQRERSRETGGLTVHSMLHFLWHEAKLNRWSESVSGKKNWNYARAALLGVASGMVTGKKCLAQRLFVPKSFAPDRRDDAKNEWARFVSSSTGTSKTQQLFLLIGKVRAFVPTKWGYRMEVFHAPDATFSLSADMFASLQSRYETEFGLNDLDNTDLVVMALFRTIPQGVAFVEDAAIMAVSKELIPINCGWEKELVGNLVKQNRHFLKVLRFDLPANRPLASALLLDTEITTALYIVPPADEQNWEFQAELEQIVAKAGQNDWFWETSEFDMPDLPPTWKTGRNR